MVGIDNDAEVVMVVLPALPAVVVDGSIAAAAAAAAGAVTVGAVTGGGTVAFALGQGLPASLTLTTAWVVVFVTAEPLALDGATD